RRLVRKPIWMAAYEKAFAGEAGLPRGPPPWHAMSGRGFAGEAGLPRGPPPWHAMSGRRLEVTLGRRPESIRRTSPPRLRISAGVAQAAPAGPLHGMPCLGGVWKLRSGDGRNRSGLHPHLVYR